ncbi:uncharacterized protein Smp_202210 [Schistosoma mansoni]|uniref:uncharacterized protein n=1 Tax=Schistosoma mansoni TaxID=6183 RepID=UPI00022DC8CC|nr:uncharacterized protein Smp_202210 [Schistosoma mansoni]|eukprot:XP_018650775.1 uncharacterized protein Smp_202210 [Schistosoma mansoni]
MNYSLKQLSVDKTPVICVRQLCLTFYMYMTKKHTLEHKGRLVSTSLSTFHRNLDKKNRLVSTVLLPIICLIVDIMFF